MHLFSFKEDEGLWDRKPKETAVYFSDCEPIMGCL